MPRTYWFHAEIEDVIEANSEIEVRDLAAQDCAEITEEEYERFLATGRLTSAEVDVSQMS